jgi:hypothetical protein
MMARIRQIGIFFGVVCLLTLFAAAPTSAQIRFERTYGGDTLDYGVSVQQTEDGGYIVAGYTYSFGAGDCDVYLVKVDSVGDTVWTRTYGGSGNDAAYCVRETRDGGCILTGYTSSFGAGSSDFYLVKTDSVGSTMWTRTYGGSDLEYGYSVQETQDGGYILAGYTESYGAGWYDVYLVKTDSAGDSVWARTYGGSDEDAGECVQQTEDGGYIVSGYTWSSGAGESDLYLVKTDSVGGSIWARTYGGSEWDFGYAVQQTEDSGYIVVGSASSFGAGSYDVYLVRTDPNGRVGVLKERPRPGVQRFDLAQNYPNPFRRLTTISYSLAGAARVALEVYDVTGRLTETLVDERQTAGLHQILWDARGQHSGIYFYRLTSGEFVTSRKLVLAR